MQDMFDVCLAGFCFVFTEADPTGRAFVKLKNEISKFVAYF